MGWLKDFGGNLLGGVLGFAGTQSTNIASAQQAQKQMDFQERMSNTAHQRQIADLRKAGLNPILSSKYGGAAAPVGAQAQMKDPTASAISAMRQKSELSNLQAQYNHIISQDFAATSAGLASRANTKAQAGNIAKAEVDRDFYNSAYGRFMRQLELTTNSAGGAAAGLTGAGFLRKKLSQTKRGKLQGFKSAQFNPKTGEIR